MYKFIIVQCEFLLLAILCHWLFHILPILQLPKHFLFEKILLNFDFSPNYLPRGTRRIITKSKNVL